MDDEESIRRNLCTYLEDEGFEAAIVDMRLPGMDGNTFIERAHDLDAGLSFVVYTGSVGYQLPEGLAKMGMSEARVFMKPLSDLSSMIEVLGELLEMRDDHEGKI